MADRPLAGSLAEQLLIARGPKAGVTAYQDKLDDQYDIELDSFYDRLFSNTSPEIAEYVRENIERLPPYQQLHNLGGLLSLIGYGTGDNTATISRYNIEELNRQGHRGNKSSKSMLAPAMLGYYPLPNETNFRNVEEKKGMYAEGAPPGKNRLLEWREGSIPPQPGEGIAVFDPVQNDMEGEAQRYRDNTHEVAGLANTIWHELIHRGLDNPVKEAFKDYKLDSVEADWEKKEAQSKASDYLPTRIPKQHQLIKQLEGKIPVQTPGRYENYAKELIEFITPEREEEYGVTMYRNPEGMSNVEKIIYDLYRD